MAGFAGHGPSGVPKFWAQAQPVGPQLDYLADCSSQQPGPVFRTVALCMAFAVMPPVQTTPPSASAGTFSAQPGPVFTRTALYQALTVPPPQVQAAAPTILGWLTPVNQPRITARLPVSTSVDVLAPPAAPNLNWLQPFPVPASLERQIDTNAALAWVPQPSFNNAPTPSTLGWLQPFSQRTAPRPFYDLNSGWAPEIPFGAPTPSTLGWLQPLAQGTAPRPFYDVNIGWTPQVPFTAAVTPSALGWLQPFSQRTAPRPFYDLNSGWVPQVPSVAVASASAETDAGTPGPVFTRRALYQALTTPPPQVPAVVVVQQPLGWLAPFATPPRETILFDTVLSPFALPETAAAASASAEIDVAQPGPVFTRLTLYQASTTFSQPVGGISPTVVTSFEGSSPQPGPVFTKQALYQAFATLPPQVPATVVVTPTLGWLQPLGTPSQPRELLDFISGWVPQSPPVYTLGWLQPLATPPQPARLRDTPFAWVPQPSFVAVTPSELGWLQPFPQRSAPRPFYDVNIGWVPQVPVIPAVTTSDLGWLQPFGIPRQPIALRDLNSGWAPQVVVPPASTPSELGWLQAFPIPPQPPRRPDFSEKYVPQDVGGVTPPTPVSTPVSAPDGGAKPHYHRRLLYELDALQHEERLLRRRAEKLKRDAPREALLEVVESVEHVARVAEAGENPDQVASQIIELTSLLHATNSARTSEIVAMADRAIAMAGAISAQIEEEEDMQVILLALS